MSDPAVLPHHLSFIFDHGRFETLALMTETEANALDHHLRAEAKLLQADAGNILRQVHIYPVNIEGRAKPGSATDLMNTIFEAVGRNGQDLDTQTLRVKAQILDRETDDFLSNPMFVMAGRPLQQTLEIKFNWILDGNNDAVDPPFSMHIRTTPSTDETTQAVLGDLADWLSENRFAEDLGYGDLAHEGTPHETAQVALAILGEGVRGAVDTGPENVVAQAWSKVLDKAAALDATPESPARRRRASP